MSTSTLETDRPRRSTRRWTRRLREDGGASAVEFAIIAPLFFMITFGAITGALLYTQNSEITHAAREGARYGATLPQNQDFTAACSSAQGTCWAESIRRYTIARAFGNLDTGVADRAVCVALVSGNPPVLVPGFVSDPEGLAPGGVGTPCYNDTAGLDPFDPDPGLRIQVVAQREGQLNAVLVQMNPTLTSRASAQYEAGG